MHTCRKPLITLAGFFSTFLTKAVAPSAHLFRSKHTFSVCAGEYRIFLDGRPSGSSCRKTASHVRSPRLRSRAGFVEQQNFHDYFVTHLPTSSLHPDSRSPTGPHHKLPRSASIPHTPGRGPSPAALPDTSREMTVVRIPLKKAKHHFGAASSRCQRPYNEDTYQAGTIEIPAFAKKTPVSLSRSGKNADGSATSANSRGGDPQVFYFGIFDGHGGSVCSEFLKDELHTYIEKSAEAFELRSSLQEAVTLDTAGDSRSANLGKTVATESELAPKGRESLSAVKSKDAVNPSTGKAKSNQIEEFDHISSSTVPKGEAPLPQKSHYERAIEFERNLVSQWKEVVGGYFRRFSPQYFSSSVSDLSNPSGSPYAISIESVMMYAFLQADLDFVAAQAAKPYSTDDQPLNANDILEAPSRLLPNHRIGGPTRFLGGSTCSVAMISTPSPTPFWHPASPSTLLVSHVGDTRILLCNTATGLPIPCTTNHHPSSPVETARLRRYAGTFVTDSFGEERMSGLANTRSFGDMRSKRIGVSAEPEIHRYELGPAEYSFIVLVSDGVSGSLSDQEIVDIVKEAKTPEQGASDLVAFATETTKDGDNATALVVRLGGWERREEGGGGGMATKETRAFRLAEAQDPRRSRR